MTDLSLRDLSLPAVTSDADFLAHHTLDNRASDARWGTGLRSLSLGERVAAWTPTASESIARIGVWKGPRLVAATTMWIPLSEDTDLVDCLTTVAPDSDERERALASEAAIDAALKRARELGRSRILMGSLAIPSGPITAHTGHGGADPEDPEVRALVARGFTLEQVYRYSVADLDALADLNDRFASATRASAGYDVVTWSGATPAVYRPDVRHLHERMSTDTPMADIPFEPQVWDDARLTAFESAKTAGGRVMLTAAARASNGSLVGYSSLFVGTSDVARQHNTLVLREHRGHGLGALVKLANLVALKHQHPNHRRVATMNAEENTPMLRVNEAAGFTTHGHEAVWIRKEAS